MKQLFLLIAAALAVGAAFAAAAPQGVDAKPLAVRAEVTPGDVKAEIGSAAGRGRLKKARHSKKAGGPVTAAVK